MPPLGNNQYQAFISYTAEDEAWAKQIHSDLQKKGIAANRLYLAEPETDPGELWREKVRAAIASSSYLIVLWSSKSRKSEWVDHEIVAFENKINTPGAELIRVHQRMIFVSLDADNKVYKDIQMIKTLKRANVYDPAAPSIDKLLKENKLLWDQVVERVYRSITRDDVSIPIPLLIMATTQDDLKNIDSTKKPPFGGLTQPLDELLGATIQMKTKAELLDRYGASRSDWKPSTGDNATVDDLLSRLKDEINTKSKLSPIRWEPVSDDFWDGTDDEAIEIADSLKNGLALIVIDPISFYDPLVSWRFSILKDQAVFDNENAVFLVLSPFTLSEPVVGFRKLIRDAARYVFDDYYLPGVRAFPYARCSVNFGDDMGMVRPVLATIKQHFHNKSKQPPVQTSVGG